MVPINAPNGRKAVERTVRSTVIVIDTLGVGESAVRGRVKETVHVGALVRKWVLLQTANGIVESRAGALMVGSGGLSVAFTSVRSPAPMATLPAPALRTGRAVFPHPALQWDHAARTRKHQDDCGPAAGDPRRRSAETARLPPSVAHRLRWGEGVSLFTPQPPRTFRWPHRALRPVHFLVPIRTFADWADTRPGFMEADLVAHCGANSEGPFLHTLVLTDVATGWTKCLALLRRTEADILQALTTVRQLLPFRLIGLDTDNGSEFMNYGLPALSNLAHSQISVKQPIAYRYATEYEDGADRLVLRGDGNPLVFLVHLAARHEDAVDRVAFRCRALRNMNRNRESEIPKHGAVNVLPIQENQRLGAVVQNQTTAVLLQTLEINSSSVDLLTQRWIGIEEPKPLSEVVGLRSELLHLEQNVLPAPYEAFFERRRLLMNDGAAPKHRYHEERKWRRCRKC